MGDSQWWAGLVREPWTQFNGVDETVSAADSLRQGKTDKADGFSFHGNELRTDFFGMASLHFDLTRDTRRCYGIIPAIDKGYFYTVFAKVNATSLTTSRDYVSLFSYTKTNVNAVNTKRLVSDCILNNLVITADGAALRKNYQTSVDNDLVQVPDAPTFNADSGTGITGTFYYRCTLIDGNNNETGGGDVSAAHTVSDKTVNPAIDITGFDTVVKGYTKIRWYRSITQATTPADAAELTYYYLGAAKDTTIVPATTTYTIADATTDADIQLNASLRNNTPVVLNGQAFLADIVFVFENRLIALGTTENGTYFKNRLRWSDITDSTEAAVGNPLSFHEDDYNDLDSTSNDGLIGGFAFGGRAWISSGDAMFQMTPTYSTERGQQFSFTQVTDAVGMYHHSCVDTGASIIGRTRNGIALFNGSVPKPIATEISDTLSRCAFPDGDTAVFEYATKRYYVSVYDPNILCSYLDSGSNQGLVRVFRNTLIVVDFDGNKVETYPKVFIQYLRKLEDTNNNERIFWAGNAGEVGMFASNSSMTGPSLTFVGTRSGDHTITGLTIGTGQLIGKTLHVLAYVSSSDGKLMFLDYKNTIASIAGNVITLTTSNPRIPFFSGTNTILCAVDVASGTATTSTASADLYDSTNYFKAANLDGYMVAGDQGAAGQTYGGISTSYATVISSTRITFSSSHGISVGQKYLLTPFNASTTGAFDSEVPSCKVLTPAFGAQAATFQKMFRHLMIKCMGSGIVRVRTFLDGQATADQTKYLTLTNSGQYKGILVNLKGSVGQYMRAELTLWRGTGFVRISEISGFYKPVGGLRNAS